MYDIHTYICIVNRPESGSLASLANKSIINNTRDLESLNIKRTKIMYYINLIFPWQHKLEWEHVIKIDTTKYFPQTKSLSVVIYFSTKFFIHITNR